MHVVVTGASAGIGRALAIEFGRAGASVTLVARRRELLEKVAKEIAGKTFIVEADLSKIDTACDFIAPAVEALGPIDVLINNAGIQYVEPVLEVDLARARILLDVDLWVPMALTQAVLPSMLARRTGAIVDIASLAALAAVPGMYHYNAAKGGLANASESLRAELRGTGVHVVTVYPGPVETDMAAAGYAAYPPSPMVKLVPSGTADVLARRVRRAVERRRPRVIYPFAYSAARWFPSITRWFLEHFAPLPFTRAQRLAAKSDTK